MPSLNLMIRSSNSSDALARAASRPNRSRYLTGACTSAMTFSEAIALTDLFTELRLAFLASFSAARRAFA